MGGGFQLREEGRPMPLPSGGCRDPSLLPARSSAAASRAVKLLLTAVPGGGGGGIPLLLLLLARPMVSTPPGDRRPAMMCGELGGGATAGRWAT